VQKQFVGSLDDQVWMEDSLDGSLVQLVLVEEMQRTCRLDHQVLVEDSQGGNLDLQVWMEQQLVCSLDQVWMEQQLACSLELQVLRED